MAKRQTSFLKRQKELAQKARRERKMERRAERQNKSTPRPENGGDDHDISHIRPGPQPLPWDDQQ